MDEHENVEDPLMAELRSMFAAADPVPAPVIEHARASIGWRRLDSDLAELLADSVLDSEQFVGTRGGMPVRSVSFRSGSMTIDLEVHKDGPAPLVLGQISPPEALVITVESSDGTTVASVRSDGLGRFRAALKGVGTIRLQLSSEPPNGRPTVHTSWISV